MSDRDMLRCGLMLFAAASMLLVACPRREPLLCGAQEACPRGLVCSEGVCIKDRDEEPDACVGDYALVDGECRQECGPYATEATCCDAHPEACDNEIDRCPSEPPEGDGILVALVDLNCEFGEVCCCGSCEPTRICTALAGEELGCFLTESCGNPFCQEP